MQETGDGLIPEDCATGEWLEPRHELLDILSRAYPRVIPGELRNLHVTDGVLEFSADAGAGSGSGASCDLQVWFPGGNQPTVEAANVEDLSLDPVEGGWLIGGCVTDEYALHAWV